MTVKVEKSSLRKVLLEKRDGTSSDLIKIASKQIQKNLKKIVPFKTASNIACYYPIGSEVLTQDIIQEALSEGKQVYLPKVVRSELVFRRITDMKNLEKGRFGILEPRDDCPLMETMDVVLIPTVGVSRDGIRLGYGYGFYDRFLSKQNSVKIALTYSKQIVKSIPSTENDVKMDWVVTEDEAFKTG